MPPLDPGHLVEVLVSPAGQVDDDVGVERHLRCDLDRLGDGVGRFERRHDAFGLGEQVEGGEGLPVVHRGVLHPAGVPPVRVLRPDRRIVEAGRHRMGRLDLAVVILNDLGPRAVEHAGRPAAGEPRGVIARARPRPPASTPTSRTWVWGTKAEKIPAALEPPPTQATTRSGNPRAIRRYWAMRLAADHGLEVANHHRIGVRTEDRTENVVGRSDIGDPVAERLVDGVLQGLRPAVDRTPPRRPCSRIR